MAEINNPNVQFLRGTQDKLNQLTSYQAGAFYLTEDTDRLYFAQNANELVYLNQHVIPVASLNDLPPFNKANIGDLYYSSAENVLCIRRDGDTSWTQINQVIDTYVYGESITFTKREKKDGEAAGSIYYDVELAQKHFNATNNVDTDYTPVSGTLSIPIEEIVSTGVSVSLSDEIVTEDKKVTLKLGGAGSDANNNSISIVYGDGLEITNTDDGYKVDGTTYSLKDELTKASENNPAQIELSLEDNYNNTNTVTFKAGTDIDFDSSENNNVIKHKVYNYTDSNLEGGLISNGDRKFTVVSGAEVSNGHITKLNTVEYTLPDDEWYKVVAVSANNEGKISIVMEDANNNREEAIVSGQDIYYTIGKDTETVIATKIFNQGDLTEYLATKEDIQDIENSLKNLNALVYRGTITAEQYRTLPQKTDNKNGDVYLVALATGESNIEYKPSAYAYTGDLLIVQGAENSNGYIDEEDFDITYVPAGNEINNTYNIRTEGTSIIFTDELSEDKTTIAFSNVSENPVQFSGNTKNTISVAHNAISTEDASGTGGTLTKGSNFDVVTGYETDGYGHITKVVTSSYTLHDFTHKLEGDSTNNKVELKDFDNNTTGTIIISGGTDIKVDTSISEDKETTTFTLNHEEVYDETKNTNDNGTLNSKGTITYIKDITVSKQGHIENIEYETDTVFEDQNTTYTLSGSVSLTENVVTVSDTLTDNNNDKTSSTHKIKSDSLKLAVDNNEISINLTWGSF